MRAVFLVLILQIAADAQAQLSGSFALMSDYRFRGVSLSDRGPALQAAAAYDHVSGLYAGLVASSVRLDAAATGLALQLYGGYARALSGQLSFDVGAARYVYPEPASGGSYDYSEVFVGVVRERLNARLYYGPNYFGTGSAAAYVEIDQAFDLNERFALFVHLGYLQRSAQTSTGPGSAPRHQWDAKLSVVSQLAGLNIEVGVVGSSAAGNSCPGPDGACSFGAVVVVSREF